MCVKMGRDACVTIGTVNRQLKRFVHEALYVRIITGKVLTLRTVLTNLFVEKVQGVVIIVIRDDHLYIKLFLS